MTEPSKAVFLSYASQDAEAAKRICDALRAAWIEVWFDQSDLRGGDVWDQKIRRQVRDCALFIPVISANTASRHEGYFRVEWDLADQRTHRIARDRAFVVPVCIDATPDSATDVPESFVRAQWTRLPAGETPPGFVQRVLTLLSRGAYVTTPAAQLPPRSARVTPAPVLLLVAGVAFVAAGYFALDKWVLSKRSVASLSAPSAIPEKSIAVLPFADMSEKKDQEYFSDGLTEELIDLLSQVQDLRVPARTSSFYFKGKNETIANIAQRLKVAHVLEGSVRKAGKRLRITAQLIRADNGYHLWSHTYDREDTDIFAVQDDIAKAVVTALQLKLAAGAQETGSRGTTNAEAYNQYLLGRHYRHGRLESSRRAVHAYSEAIALDPNYAGAYAELALAEADVADLTGDAGGIERAGRDVDKAIALAPNDATGYSARSVLRATWLWDWSGAQADIEKALILDPRNSAVQLRYARLLKSLGRLPEAIVALKEATKLDPLSGAWDQLGRSYMATGDYGLADAALDRAIELEPTGVFELFNLGTLRLLQRRSAEALEAFRKLNQEGLRLMWIAMAEHT
ncbi:MAG: TIR domain-containing protein, partial [Terriglobales bacterium]